MAPAKFRLEDFVVDPAADRITRAGVRVDLEPKTMAVLLVLAARPGEVVSSEDLIHEVWRDRPMGENPVYKAIGKLRRALADESAAPRYIETIPRKGYRLLVKPQPVADAPAAASGPEVEAAARWRHATIVERPGPRLVYGTAAGLLLLALALAASLLLPSGAALQPAHEADRKAQRPRDSLPIPRLQFLGLDDADSPGGAVIDQLLSERLAQLPGVVLTQRRTDAPLASLRLSGDVRPAGREDRMRVRLRLDGPRGPGIWDADLEVAPTDAYRIADAAAGAVLEAARLLADRRRSVNLPLPALQLYLRARSELRDRRAGFATRLRAESADLVRAAPDFAAGHALQAIACTFGLAETARQSVSTAAGRPVDADSLLACARSAVRRTLQLDPARAEGYAAAGFLAYVEHETCDDGCDDAAQLDTARASLERAVRLDPGLPEARTWLALVYAERGDFARSAEQQEAALELDPLSPVEVVNSTSALMARGEYSQARERLVVLAQRPGVPPHVFRQLAEIAAAEGKTAEALDWARRLARQDRGRAAQVDAAVLLAQSGAIDEAREALASVDGPGHLDQGETLWRALQAHQLLGGPAEARAYLEAQQRRLASHPGTDVRVSDREWHRFEGFAYVLAGDPVKALPPLEAAFGASGPPRIRARAIAAEADGANALAWAYRMLGNEHRAREVADGTLQWLDRLAVSGFDHEPYYTLARALACDLAGRAEEARAEIRRAVSMGWGQFTAARLDPRWAGLSVDAVAGLADTRASR